MALRLCQSQGRGYHGVESNVMVFKTRFPVSPWLVTF
ncbi:MAG: hypothetical protein RIR70_1514 [Pseudomonadota bacterium]|jgi:hypothetical protein